MEKKSLKVKCIRNDSKSLPFAVNGIYTRGFDHGGGQFEFYDGQGSNIIAPMRGHYVEFVLLK